MDEITNEEVQAETPKRVRRRKKSKLASIPIPVFLTRIGEDVKWYYDVRLWSPLILLLLIIALLIPVRQKAAPEQIPEQTVPIVTLPPVATEPEPEPVNEEAAALARLADSVGAGRSENVKTIIMWIAINRSEDRSNGYGQSLLEEIARPNQWQGYDENIGYSEQSYAIAKSVLETQQKNGLRPIDPDMLWLVLNDNGSVTVRNQFTAKKDQKWHEKTIQ